jgi:ribosome biogenesis GTPase
VIPPTQTLVGTVFRILGKAVSVRVGDDVYECYLRGRLFEGGAQSETRSQLAVGDNVELTPLDRHEGMERGVIHSVRERETMLVRQLGGKKPRLQVLAANLDQLVIVSALDRPRFKTGLIDRYLVIAHHAGIAPALVLNKIDLGDERAREEARAELSIYEKLGYPVVMACAKSGEGLQALRDTLRDRRSALAGHSGVGKTKLAAAIQPGIELSSGSVDRRGKGRHTTTASTLFPLGFGGELVDTPGVRELSIRHVPREALAPGFVEMRPYLGKCHFATCSHTAEPYCAVKKALTTGAISKPRYESYCHLFEELHP